VGWGLGVGAVAPTPKPQIPNPQSPIPNPHKKILKKINKLRKIKKY